MLLDKKDMLKILRCPKSGNSLKKLHNKLVSEFNEEKVEYEIIKDYPVLIDFEKSILEREGMTSLSSVIERPHMLDCRLLPRV